MTIEKLPSGSYRIKQMYKGKRYSVTVDHKPTIKEALLLIGEEMDNVSVKGSAKLSVCLSQYIESKTNVLSPSTITSYRQLSRMFPDWLLNMNVYDIEQLDIQNAVNEYAINHSPKSVKNYHGLLSSAIKLYRPNFTIRTTLPSKQNKETILPSEEDVKRIIELSKNTEYYIPLLLGCCGLRRSELCALTLEDVNGEMLTINKTLVLKGHEYVIRNNTKTDASTRTIYIGETIANAVREKGYIYKGYPNNIIRALHRFQDELGIPRFRFHDLRHFYCSYAHSKGMNEADILANGGWVGNSDVMRKVYRHAMSKDEANKRILSDLF